MSTEPVPTDSDTCRICRGEGSREEPLFFPCKCSGSIKFVHQDCLMEWLSHSQKKYCELCKTPFRFTKLYDPKMPRTLPAAIFLQKAAGHLGSRIIWTFRVILVTFVWLMLVPWMMRSVWRILFWTGDAGWARTVILESEWIKRDNVTLQPLPLSTMNSPSLQLNNVNVTESFIFKVFKTLFAEMLLPAGRIELEVSMTNSSYHPVYDEFVKQKYSSILSHVDFLKNLTRSLVINRAIMDVLEGLIITISVIIAFILVFLIREWVIQQQPLVELGQANGDPLAEAGGQAANVVPPQADQPQPQPVPEPEPQQEPEQEQEQEPEPEQEPEIVEPGEAREPVNFLENLEFEHDEHDGGQHENDEEDQHEEQNQEEENYPNTFAQRQFEEMYIRPFAHERIFGNDSTMATRASSVDLNTVPSPSRRVFSYSPGNENSEGSQSFDEKSYEAPNSEVDTSELDSSNRQTSDMEESTYRLDQMSDSTEVEPLFTPESSRGTGENSFADGNSSEASTGSRDQTQQSLTAWLYNFFWGDIVPITTNEDLGNDEHVVENIADEEPFVRFAGAEPILPEPVDQFADGEPDDADAVEDAEDLEGILELVGIQGPMIGLVQNALFCCMLITGTVMCTVLTPYLLGKLVLIHVGNIDLLWRIPLEFASMIADFAADIISLFTGVATYWLAKVFMPLSRPLNLGNYNVAVTDYAQNLAERASVRIIKSIPVSTFSDPSFFLAGSIEAHASLKWIHSLIWSYLQAIFFNIVSATENPILETLKKVFTLIVITFPMSVFQSARGDVEGLTNVMQSIWTNGTIPLKGYNSHLTGDPEADNMLAYWSAGDRLEAIAAGYTCIALLATIYVSYLAPIASSPSARRAEERLVDVIKQAGGIFKVIFIISIEMIAFPLFCGFLLDFALLPLFENSTVKSRVSFTVESPWTSGFVHWFVGTCYMFHFALFVSMCRKIMRNGVLYFIRDPDDPTFHPVRDVLERNVTVQLRKIAFSAIVYGTLITVCLGGVVWGLWASSDKILPIRWSSSESALEFPLDIMFFNFLTPMVVKFAKPADGLHKMYQWWFRRCAKSLRLSSFLFGEDVRIERGHIIRRTWKGWFTRKEPKLEDEELQLNQPNTSSTSNVNSIPEKVHTESVSDAIETEPFEEVIETKQSSNAGKHQIEKSYPQQTESPKDIHQDVYFVPDGKYVRAPAVDQIRIPKGAPVFVEVDNNNILVNTESVIDLYAEDSRMVTQVYIPPWFKLRIALFVVAVWLFAAATGVSVTIVPLMLGRSLLSLGRENSKINDIYAFSLGVYILGAMIFCLINVPRMAQFFKEHVLPRMSIFRFETLRLIAGVVKQILSIIYVYASLAILLPALLAVIMELYVLIPLHTAIGNEDTHVVHLVQDWTLGILYARILAHAFVSPALLVPVAAAAVAEGQLPPQNNQQPTRPHIILLTILRPNPREGFLNPSAKLATRAFVLPCLLAFTALAFGPFTMAWILNHTLFNSIDSPFTQKFLELLRSSDGSPLVLKDDAALEMAQTRLMRFAYPFVAMGLFILYTVWSIMRVTSKWRMRIRDEVYLIGERLHNFGEGKKNKKVKFDKGKNRVNDL